jgi:hypothetical protein
MAAKKSRFQPRKTLSDNPAAIESLPKQIRNGDLFATSGREPERDRGQCQSDHFRHLVAASYRCRV